MARVPGVKFEKDAHGNKRYVRIDLKQHSEAVKPLLQQLGALPTEDNDDDFEKKWKNGITMDELRTDVIEYLKTLPWKK